MKKTIILTAAAAVLLAIFIYASYRKDTLSTSTANNHGVVPPPGQAEILATSEGIIKAEIVGKEKSPYGDITIYDYGGAIRCYMIGGATPSCWNFKKERSSTYVEDILKILNFVDQDAKHNVLVIGAGSGGLVRKLDKGKFNIDAVEINPKMKEIAVKYFGVDLEEISNLTIDDARHFLTNSKKKYDIIVVDLCEVNDYNAHLFTKEFYEIAKAHLKDEKNGLVITSRNIVVEEEKSILLDQYISNAVLSVFDHYTQTKETTGPGTFETTVFILTDRPDLSTHPELSFIEKSTDENNITANDDITKQMVRLGQSATAALRNQTINNFSEELLLF